ncbi:hypothetical protein V8D89_002051 [Ganoderma adspersum]
MSRRFKIHRQLGSSQILTVANSGFDLIRASKRAQMSPIYRRRVLTVRLAAEATTYGTSIELFLFTSSCSVLFIDRFQAHYAVTTVLRQLVSTLRDSNESARHFNLLVAAMATINNGSSSSSSGTVIMIVVVVILAVSFLIPIVRVASRAPRVRPGTSTLPCASGYASDYLHLEGNRAARAANSSTMTCAAGNNADIGLGSVANSGPPPPYSATMPCN